MDGGGHESKRMLPSASEVIELMASHEGSRHGSESRLTKCSGRPGYESFRLQSSVTGLARRAVFSRSAEPMRSEATA